MFLTVLLCGFETWSHTLRVEYRPRVFVKGNEVTGSGVE